MSRLQRSEIYYVYNLGIGPTCQPRAEGPTHIATYCRRRGNQQRRGHAGQVKEHVVRHFRMAAAERCCFDAFSCVWLPKLRRLSRPRRALAAQTPPANPFPAINPKFFTATSPTVETVNAFLTQLWGFRTGA